MNNCMVSEFSWFATSTTHFATFKMPAPQAVWCRSISNWWKWHRIHPSPPPHSRSSKLVRLWKNNLLSVFIQLLPIFPPVYYSYIKRYIHTMKLRVCKYVIQLIVIKLALQHHTHIHTKWIWIDYCISDRNTTNTWETYLTE